MAEEKKLKVVRGRYRNVLGIEWMEFEFGRGYTLLRGPNESGKTSILRGTKSLFAGSGARDAVLLRKGAEEGEAVLVLDDGTEVDKRFGVDGSELEVRRPDGSKVQRPQAFVDQLVAWESLDPVALITAESKRERVDLLLRAAPVKLDPAELEAAVAGALPGTKIHDRGLNPFQLLDAVDQRIYEEREAVGRIERDKHATADSLEKDLPSTEVLSEDLDSEEKQLQAALAEAMAGEESALRGPEAETRARLAELEKRALEERRAAEDAAAAESTAAAESFRAEQVAADGELIKRQSELEPAIAQLEERLASMRRELGAAVSEHGRKMEDLARRGDVEVRRMRERAEAKASEVASRLRIESNRVRDEAAGLARAAASAAAERRARLESELKSLRERRRERDRQLAVERLAGEARDEAERAAGRYAAFTAARERVFALRQRLLEQLPIPGLTVSDGDIYLDGVEFDSLSGAQQVELALEVASRAPGRLGLIVVDELERLDADRFALFREAVERRGDVIQVLAARAEVTEDGRLKVETNGS